MTGAAEKRQVALTSVIAAVALTAMKLTVGLATQSLGILSEALHSALDLAAAGITLFAVRASARPADDRHSYGHGKFENMSALFETLLLLETCVWIIFEATERLFTKDVHVDVTLWSFIVMATSIIIDASRSRALARAAKKFRSQALEADALHFSTDIWSSSVVIVGLAGVALAGPTGLPWLGQADALAALGVAGIVVWISVQLGRKTIADLLDEVPKGLRDDIRAAVMVPGVVGVERVRVRRSGPEAFVDVTLFVGRHTTVERGHEVADHAEAAVHAILPDADVVVHIEPSSDAAPGDDASVPALARATAARLGLEVHSIQYHDIPGSRTLELHIEVDEHLDVATAHAQATELEAALHSDIGGLDRVVTHIEPAGSSPELEQPVPALEHHVLAILHSLSAELGGSCAPHDLGVRGRTEHRNRRRPRSDRAGRGGAPSAPAQPRPSRHPRRAT
jgi:cation diffusion facilitator family transporter